MARCIPSVYFGGVKDREDQCFIGCVSVLLGVRWVVWCLAVVVCNLCGGSLFFNCLRASCGCGCRLVVLVTMQHVLCLGIVFSTDSVCVFV